MLLKYHNAKIFWAFTVLFSACQIYQICRWDDDSWNCGKCQIIGWWVAFVLCPGLSILLERESWSRESAASLWNFIPRHQKAKGILLNIKVTILICKLVCGMFISFSVFLSYPLTFFSPLWVFYSSLFSVSVSIGFILVELVIIITESSITSGFTKETQYVVVWYWLITCAGNWQI